MFKVKIIAIGRSKETWLQDSLAEYEKRLQGRVAFQWCFAEDTSALATFCRKEKQLIALDLQGELVNSETFLEKWMHLGSRASFVIGGPDGLPTNLLNQAKWRWSLSPLTFTNQIVRLLLVEQIYRALEIAKGSPYHK